MNKSSTSTSNTSATQHDGKQDGLVDQAKHAVTHVAGNVAGNAREQVNHEFDARKDKAVETMGTVANAIRDTSDKLKGVGPLGDVAGRAADGIESVANFFEGKQITDVVRDVERFARREPAIFLGAAFALGLIGGRFLKSSAHRSSSASGGSSAYARGGSGYGYDREAFGRNYGSGSYDDAFLADDDFDYAADSRRYGTQAGRGTLPMGSRTPTAPTAPKPPTTSSASASTTASMPSATSSTKSGSSPAPGMTQASTSGATSPSTAPSGGYKNGTGGGNAGSV